MKTISTPKHNGTGTTFNNPILEKLTRTHISLPLIVFSAISSYLIYRGSTVYGLTVYQHIALFVAGYMAFTLVEYLMHRFVFHMDESTTVKKKLVYTLHGVHHGIHHYKQPERAFGVSIPFWDLVFRTMPK